MHDYSSKSSVRHHNHFRNRLRTHLFAESVSASVILKIPVYQILLALKRKAQQARLHLFNWTNTVISWQVDGLYVLTRSYLCSSEKWKMNNNSLITMFPHMLKQADIGWIAECSVQLDDCYLSI